MPWSANKWRNYRKNSDARLLKIERRKDRVCKRIVRESMSASEKHNENQKRTERYRRAKTRSSNLIIQPIGAAKRKVGRPKKIVETDLPSTSQQIPFENLSTTESEKSNPKKIESPTLIKLNHARLTAEQSRLFSRSLSQIKNTRSNSHPLTLPHSSASSSSLPQIAITIKDNDPGFHLIEGQLQLSATSSRMII